MNIMTHSTGILDWASEKVAGQASVVLPSQKANTNTIYVAADKGLAWRPVQLPYHANWDQLSHDGEKFIVEDSSNSRLQAVSKDGKVWHDAGT